MPRPFKELTWEKATGLEIQAAFTEVTELKAENRRLKRQIKQVEKIVTSKNGKSEDEGTE